MMLLAYFRPWQDLGFQKLSLRVMSMKHCDWCKCPSTRYTQMTASGLALMQYIWLYSTILRDEGARASSMDARYAHALNLISRKVQFLLSTYTYWYRCTTQHGLIAEKLVGAKMSESQGYSEAQLKECLEEYASLNVWQIHPSTFDIHFIDAWCRSQYRPPNISSWAKEWNIKSLLLRDSWQEGWTLSTEA